MADKVKFRIHCTPLEDITDENLNTHTVMASEIGRTLGGAGEVVVADYAGTAANQGYLNKTVNYLSADDGAGSHTDISAETSASFVFIKNTGRKFVDATTLGDPLTASLLVMRASNTISILDAGEAIILKDNNRGLNCTGIHVRTVTTAGADDATLTNLAVEYLVVD
tara:strand:- start:5309 stop:5809 length:501 start_codon:yes stop_codon:yes gene_type:complete